MNQAAYRQADVFLTGRGRKRFGFFFCLSSCLLLFIAVVCLSVLWDYLMDGKLSDALLTALFTFPFVYPVIRGIRTRLFARQARFISERLASLTKYKVTEAELVMILEGHLQFERIGTLLAGNYLKGLTCDPVKRCIYIHGNEEVDEKEEGVHTLSVHCPGCGALVAGEQGLSVTCEYCGRRVKITED